ncbi:MAG: GIY-YIG nuclease family protein [Pirellulaceae bacterium]
MEATLQEEKFIDFGKDGLYPFARTGLCSIESDDPKALKAQVRQYVPKEPGVYGMLDPLGRLVYVGKSKCLRNRLLSYFMPNNEEDKAGRIVQSTATIVWELQPSEFAALLREQFLIRHFQPRFNVQGIPRRQQPIFVCLGRKPAEMLYTARRFEPNASFCIGPLSGAARASRAVEVLNRIFLLRDCSSQQPCSFTEQLQLFDIELRPGCIRLEMETCLGPCISACSRAQYDAQVAEARSFLKGKCERPLEVLESQIQQASDNWHFERAAVLREDQSAVNWLHRRATDLALARHRYTFVYPVTPYPSDAQQRVIWYLIRRGIIEGAIAEPRGQVEEKAVGELIHQWLASDQSIGSEFTARPETLALVSSWFRKHRGELKKTMSQRKIRARFAA